MTLEIGTKWLEKKKGIGRDILTLSEIAIATTDEGEEKTFYRMDKYWPFLSEEEVHSEYMPVLSTEGKPHSKTKAY